MNEIVFIPYNPWFHWIVMVIDLFSMDVYWLDSAPGPMQPDGKQCGIHAMRCFMRGIMSDPSPLPLKARTRGLASWVRLKLSGDDNEGVVSGFGVIEFLLPA
ncbi:hypothetical protein IFM89_020117 [Coptis chinensis]|uniref:Ubiquitin-like protease family profile domain-containing protein n=1 Tax=Coptis chinensis TaxID=261450 RepID=A0A835IYW9_9MAGN|nr:hypothetical protein IFM89_020117 [Coptis chinensis]